MSAYSDLILAEPGLVSYWRLGEASGSAVDSKGANPGTYTGGITLAQPGAPYEDTDGSMKPNGTTGYVNVPTSASLNLGDGPLTIEAWVKRNTVGTLQGIVCRGDGGFYVRFNTANQIEFLSNNTASICTATATAAADGRFHHIVVTKNAAAVKIYVDSVDVTGAITNATLTNPAQNLGIGQQNATNLTEWFNGWIDEAALYNVVLNARTVLEHYLAINRPNRSHIASWGRRPVPMIQGPDTDQITRMQLS